MATQPCYSRDESDARLAALRLEFRADIKDECGAIRVEIATMKDEMKMWMVVLGAVLTIVSSGFGSRLLNLVWPLGQ